MVDLLLKKINEEKGDVLQMLESRLRNVMRLASEQKHNRASWALHLLKVHRTRATPTSQPGLLQTPWAVMSSPGLQLHWGYQACWAFRFPSKGLKGELLKSIESNRETESGQAVAYLLPNSIWPEMRIICK